MGFRPHDAHRPSRRPHLGVGRTSCFHDSLRILGAASGFPRSLVNRNDDDHTHRPFLSLNRICQCHSLAQRNLDGPRSAFLFSSSTHSRYQYQEEKKTIGRFHAPACMKRRRSRWIAPATMKINGCPAASHSVLYGQASEFSSPSSRILPLSHRYRTWGLPVGLRASSFGLAGQLGVGFSYFDLLRFINLYFIISCTCSLSSCRSSSIATSGSRTVRLGLSPHLPPPLPG